MANLKEIKNRITSISSTMQITSAMKMVSAAKLRRAQDAITQMRPYSNKLQEILSMINQKEGKKVRLLIERYNKDLLFSFVVEDIFKSKKP